MFTCKICNAVVASISGLCTHIRLIHPQNIMSSYDCCWCAKKYSSLQWLKEHLKRKHAERENDAVRDVPVNIIAEERVRVEQEDDPIVEQIVAEPLEGAEVSVLDFKTALYESSLGLAAKLYSQNTLNRSQIQDIISIVTDFLGSGFLDVVKAKTVLMLRNYDGPNNNMEGLLEMFNAMQDAFIGLKTESQRLRALEESQCFIRPQKYVIGVGEQVRNIEGNAVLTPVDLTGQYLPMKSVLQQFFQLPGVLSSTLRNLENLKNSRKFENVVQSPVWRDIEERHFRGRLVLPLHLFFDDAEPDNHTGAHAGSHKLGIVYYQVPCIPQYLLSALENIFVAVAFLSNDGHGDIEAAFQPIINDLRDLETNGIRILTEDGCFQVFFALCLVLGDNLGIHQVTGYVTSFNANFYCRRCKVHRDVARVQLRENIELTRNIENYRLDVTTNDYSVTGIKRECMFNQLSTFKVTTNIAFDFMHDFLEGVCHYDLCALILEYLSLNYFTIDTLNERIQNFDYSFDSGNKPSFIAIEHLRNEKLKFSASEMYFFVRHLGLIIGDLVPEGDEYWKLYMYLAEILDIISAPYVRAGVAEYLATLIAEHHEVYVNIFLKTLKPKHHFMIHYPRVMNMVGPLIHVWCMRLEGKHRPVIKQSARSHTCRKNLPLTTILRYSLGLSARILAKRGFSDNVEFHPNEKNVTNVDNLQEFQNILPPEFENCTVVKQATVRGILYCKNMVLVINYVNSLPLFGLLHWVVKPVNQNEKAWFLLSGYHTVGFNNHLHSYEVRRTAEWFFVEYGNLVSFYPSTCRNGADGYSYIAFRHEL